MNRGDFKNIIRRRCANHPALTPAFIRSLMIQTWLELSIKTRVFKSYQDITLVSGQRAYPLTCNTVTIDKVYFGDAETIADETQCPLKRDVDYRIEWRDVVGYKQLPHILVDADINAGEILRVIINEMNEANFPDMTAANDALTLDSLINPGFQLALLDGCVAHFKVEYLKSPDAAIAVSNYSDTLNETGANINERVEFVD